MVCKSNDDQNMYVTREGLVLSTLYMLPHAHNDPMRRGTIITPTLQMHKLRFRETIPRLYRWHWVSNQVWRATSLYANATSLPLSEHFLETAFKVTS